MKKLDKTAQIHFPGLVCRDTTEVQFYMEDGIEYLKVNAYLLVSELSTNGAFSEYDEQGLCVNNTMLGAKFMLCKYHFYPFSDRSRMIEVSMKPTVITTN